MHALEPADKAKIDALVARLRARELDLREFSNGILDLPGAADPVLIAEFPDGGGLISFLKPDGRAVHTLNTPEGLARKRLALSETRPGVAKNGPGRAGRGGA